MLRIRPLRAGLLYLAWALMPALPIPTVFAAQNLVSFTSRGWSWKSATKTGHEGRLPYSTPRQHITRVVSVQSCRASSRTCTFIAAYQNFVPDELKSWRLDWLTGALTGASFKIASNTKSSITVINEHDALSRMSAGDMILIEEVIVRDIPAR
jgi:hypothetical protein